MHGRPPMAEMLVDGMQCQVMPDLCQPDYSLLGQCIAYVKRHRTEIQPRPNEKRVTLPAEDGHEFVFFVEKIGGVDIVMIVTSERFSDFWGRSN